MEKTFMMLDKPMMTALIRGTHVPVELFDHELVLKYGGSYSDSFGIFSWESLEKAEIQDLVELSNLFYNRKDATLT